MAKKESNLKAIAEVLLVLVLGLGLVATSLGLLGSLARVAWELLKIGWGN
jgi:hypothetical protein